jgi:hypothetical protein
MKSKLKLPVVEAARLNEAFKEANVQCKSLSKALRKNDPRSWFEKFYDSMTNLLSGGKSFAPNELKPLR